MTEHDHQPAHTEPEPTLPADPGEAFADPRSPHLVQTVEEHVNIVRDGIARYGEPFLAYLILDGVDQRSQGLIEEFERSFIGFFPERVAFALDRMEHNNWEGNVEAFVERLGLPASVIRWDYEELWEHLAEQYRVTERLGGVYAFER